jgi:Holliday junction DNA helicase RuvA
MSGNADLLSQVPGIGKKTAGRIILELKGKFEKGWEGEIIPSGITQADSDTIAALTALGYSIREATQALSSVQATDNMPVEEKIKLALQQLAKR